MPPQPISSAATPSADAVTSPLASHADEEKERHEARLAATEMLDEECRSLGAELRQLKSAEIKSLREESQRERLISSLAADLARLERGWQASQQRFEEQQAEAAQEQAAELQ